MARALVGTEGTCVVILEAKIKLINNPPHRSLVALGFDDAFIAADHVPEILEVKPIALEGIEGSIIDGLRRKQAPHMDLLPEGHGFLLVEFGSDDPADSRAQTEQLMTRLRRLPETSGLRASTPRKNQGTSGRFAKQVREQRPLHRARPPNGKAGMMLLWRRKSWAPICVISAS